MVHLVTAAVGAEAFYSLANNAARTEGFEMARELDQKCQTAWCGHPALDVIDNASGFDEKMLRLIAVRSASGPTRPDQTTSLLATCACTCTALFSAPNC